MHSSNQYTTHDTDKCSWTFRSTDPHPHPQALDPWIIHIRWHFHCYDPQIIRIRRSLALCLSAENNGWLLPSSDWRKIIILSTQSNLGVEKNLIRSLSEESMDNLYPVFLEWLVSADLKMLWIKTPSADHPPFAHLWCDTENEVLKLSNMMVQDFNVTTTVN